ncbi:DNA damage-regulated autophagy modulator protein 2-like [Pomacea canaliculata]|uniref:DNA damage-regulated autophagy modulator protein 2-like n=1 Tax=Pomacea canaliculata TaxID=400727 RepID=UPI000D73A772|nr:DNA damage-regulated autophagy modulator protein 2-like [Pomacea canaliculata]
MEFRGHWLPLIQLLLLPLCCIITYGWSVALGHVQPGFPYISDTGTYPPESCLFGLLLSCYSFVTATSVYVRWRQVRTVYLGLGTRVLHRVNNAGLVTGFLASFGVLVVASFQETNALIVHLLGAFLAFGVGAVYFWLQTYLTFRTLQLPGHRKCLRSCRLVMAIVVTVCFVLVLIFAERAMAKSGLSGMNAYDWGPSDEGFTDHVVSAAFEWVTAFVSAAFFASFFGEFRHFTITMATVTFFDLGNGEHHENGGVANGGFSSWDLRSETSIVS